MALKRSGVTIRDVARQAKVSPATVSLVLNNNPSVAATTREHVRRVIGEANYKRDGLARSLSSGRAEAIALVMPFGMDSFHDPYYINLLSGVLEAVRDADYKMLLEIADARFVGQRIWDDLLAEKRIDGLIVATPQTDHAYLAELAGRGAPVLLLNGARPDLPSLDYVGYDDVRCGHDATEYLMSLGHTRIAHLAGTNTQASALNRAEGYRQAMEKAGLFADTLCGDYSASSAASTTYTLLERPIKERPTALFCANDTLALRAMETLREVGLRVPDDISLVGVDDTGMAAKSTPGLTTLRQNIYGLSRFAAEQFLDKVKRGNGDALQVSRVMPFVKRESCRMLMKGEALA